MKDADEHIRDPASPFVCLCGKVFAVPPSDEEWQEHKYGPPEQS